MYNIALFFDVTAIVLASATSPNSLISRFGAVYSANSLILPCDVRACWPEKILSVEVPKREILEKTCARALPPSRGQKRKNTAN